MCIILRIIQIKGYMMKKYILLTGLFILFSATASSAQERESDIIEKYNQIRENNYLEKLIQERESLEQNRNVKALIRDYENVKIYCSLDSQTRC